MKCENCGGDWGVSRFQIKDIVFLPLFLRPVRCVSCKKRSYRPFWTRDLLISKADAPRTPILVTPANAGDNRATLD
jgi:hypothetical protein